MTAADDFQIAAEQVANDTERQAMVTYAAFVAGSINLDSATARLVGEVNRGNAAATTLADAYVVAAVEELSGQPTPATGLLPVDESVRLVKAMRTILAKSTNDVRTDHGGTPAGVDPEPAEPPDAVKRLTRLTHAEVFSSAQRGAVNAMTKQPAVSGWVRQFESEHPCELCVWIARDGRVWPKNHPFQVMHPMDRCVPRIVITTETIEPVGGKRRGR